jgi:hypothetical protein
MTRLKWLLMIFYSKTKHFLWFVGLVYCSIGISIADEMVCGKLSGHVIEVSREYFAFWPEYEGKSSWEKGFTNNKKGCGANLVSVPMVMTWPEMAPANHVTYFEQALEFEGLSVTLRPRRVPGTNLRALLEFFLSSTPLEWKRRVRFDETLGLFYVDGNHRVFAGDISRYYWLEIDSEISVVIECLWLAREDRLYTCEASYILKEVEASAIIRFTPEKVKDWKVIIGMVEKFVVDKIRK